MKPQNLSILTLNCQRGYRHRKLKVFLEKVLSANTYDFLLLQEVSHEVYEILRQVTASVSTFSFTLATNTLTKELVEQVFVYRKEFYPTHLTHFHFYNATQTEFSNNGVLYGTFSIPAKYGIYPGSISLCNIHLQAGLHKQARNKALAKLKAHIIKSTRPQNELILIAGDFNTLIYSELSSHKTILKPEFEYISEYNGYSHISSLIEPIKPANKFIYLLSRLGIIFCSRLDHFFVNEFFVNYYDFTCNVLHNINVSDHFPVELIVSRANI